ncbi:OLC1v1009748C1 [Oldenlandia corymbosa var. corymbosa]|uniref:Exocyst subunit Exo70 family protein n=1 Tax=Oldenlandia corymbosa var. corymbosa TaxID=529605 RepID=A0AAV1DS22_OLDCO|nr:OLC1v1009748C1 [Oldenlandia corymbosa var. corymbosa]
MGECEPLASAAAPASPMLEGEENLIAAAQNIVKALETNKNLTFDARKILADLGSQLSSIARVSENGEEEEEDDGERLDEVEEQLNRVQDKIMKWEENQANIWDCGPDEACEYLKAVEDTRKLIESLESMNIAKDSREDGFLQRAHDVLHTGMVRLEDEFKHLLVQNRQPFEPEHMSFRSSEDEILDDRSVMSFGDESVEDSLPRDSLSRAPEDYIIELVHPDAIPDLKSIAILMFDSGYGPECSQAYVGIRKDALDDYLFTLVDKLSVEDVMKMEWNSLNSKIRRWVRAMKVFVRVYLASEKWLCDQIFGELDTVSSGCFTESSKASVLQLLNFGDAVAIGPHQPEKLFRILDMYEVLADLIPDIDALYLGDDDSSIRMECQDVLGRLGDCAKATFLEFENAVAANISATAFPGGGIHHLTRYVMNYIKFLADYCTTLDVLLKDNDKAGQVSPSPDTSPVSDEDNTSSDGSYVPSPVTLHFRSLLSILECNLDDKSRLYKDDSLGHLFLMNNIHYMAEKTKGSDKLRTILGDGWIRKHNWKFQQHAMNYERATWSSILSLLRDEGIQNPGSNSVSKTLLKEKLQSFYLAFEEVYKSQTGWSIPDGQLREDLRISISLKVIQAYRTFVGRHTSYISEKHIKYNADDLEDLILDFFEGSPKSLHGSHRK